MIPPRRAKLVLLVLAVSFVGLGVWAWEPVWWWVMTKRVPIKGSIEDFEDAQGNRVTGETRGWAAVNRWSPEEDRKSVQYWDNGFKAVESVRESGRNIYMAMWSRDGRVMFQSIYAGGENNTLTKPPWKFGICDQTGPAAPGWVLDDELWQAALDAQE